MMSVIWTLMLASAILYGAATGRAAQVGAAAMEGASAAVSLCVSIAGMICLWSGVMEVMRRSGILDVLSRCLRGPLTFLFPEAMSDEAAASAISANVSANLLGLGNAATPSGIRACREMARLGGGDGRASKELCGFVVLNTVSIQLLPTTIAAVRSAAGAAVAFDILPAVLLTSVAAVAAGLVCSRILSEISP